MTHATRPDPAVFARPARIGHPAWRAVNITPAERLAAEAHDQGNERHGHGGHGWMMIACCIPMLMIAIALVATGVVSASFLGVAIACTAMMALMMWGMGHGESGRS